MSRPHSLSARTRTRASTTTTAPHPGDFDTRATVTTGLDSFATDVRSPAVPCASFWGQP